MAILTSQFQQKRLVLRATHTFGRNPASAQTVLLASDTSQIHASIRWNSQRWEIIDLSRNGTFVDGRRLTANTWTTLALGQSLQFGHARESQWKVDTLDPPATLLAPTEDDGALIPLNPLHNLLPNEEQAEVSLHVNNAGLWVIEDEQGEGRLQDGQILTIAGRRFEFICSPQLQETVDMRSARREQLANPLFNFHASQDEEHISPDVTVGTRKVELGERTHHYCLLTLARERLADRKRGLDSSSEGWVPLTRLSQMLGLEVAHINIQIFRARNQLMQALPEALAWPELVERRRGEVRFGALDFRIVRGAHAEGELLHQAGSTP